MPDPPDRWTDTVQRIKGNSAAPIESEAGPAFPVTRPDSQHSTMEDPLGPRRSWSEIAQALGRGETMAPPPKEPITAPTIHFEEIEEALELEDGFPTLAQPIQIDLASPHGASRAGSVVDVEPELPPRARRHLSSEDATDLRAKPRSLSNGDDLLSTVNEVSSGSLPAPAWPEPADPATDIAFKQPVIEPAPWNNAPIEDAAEDLASATQLLDEATASSLGLPVPKTAPREPSRPTRVGPTPKPDPSLELSALDLEPRLQAQPVQAPRPYAGGELEEESILGFLVEPTGSGIASGAESGGRPEYTVAAPGELAGLSADLSFPDFGEGLELEAQDSDRSQAVRQGLAAPVPQHNGEDLSLSAPTPPFEQRPSAPSRAVRMTSAPFDEAPSNVPPMTPHIPAEVTDSGLEVVDSGQLSMPGDVVAPIDADDGWLHPALGPPDNDGTREAVEVEDTRHLPQAHLPLRLRVTPLWRRLLAMAIDGGLALAAMVLVALQLLKEAPQNLEPEAFLLSLFQPLRPRHAAPDRRGCARPPVRFRSAAQPFPREAPAWSLDGRGKNRRATGQPASAGANRRRAFWNLLPGSRFRLGSRRSKMPGVARASHRYGRSARASSSLLSALSEWRTDLDRSESAHCP